MYLRKPPKKRKGSPPVSPELAVKIYDACDTVQDMRLALVSALGMILKGNRRGGGAQSAGNDNHALEVASWDYGIACAVTTSAFKHPMDTKPERY